MPILNYTTSISTEKTAAEIQRRLADAKAQAVMCEYDAAGVMCAMSFRIQLPSGPISFRLPANTEGVYRSLRDNRRVPSKYKTREQAARVVWRILKDWVEAQVAIVEADMAAMDEVFFPYAQSEITGETLYSRVKASGYKLLKAPDAK
jgi:hypothetical protein